jgi:hypothetical protein
MCACTWSDVVCAVCTRIIVRLPIGIDIEVQISTVFGLEQGNAIAERGLTRKHRTNVARAEIRTPARLLGAESKARHYSWTIDRHTTFDREGITAQPTADQGTQIQLRVGRNAVISTQIEESA